MALLTELALAMRLGFYKYVQPTALRAGGRKARMRKHGRDTQAGIAAKAMLNDLLTCFTMNVLFMRIVNSM